MRVLQGRQNQSRPASKSVLRLVLVVLASIFQFIWRLKSNAVMYSSGAGLSVLLSCFDNYKGSRLNSQRLYLHVLKKVIITISAASGKGNINFTLLSFIKNQMVWII